MSDAIKYPYHALIQQKFLLHHSEFKHLNTNLYHKIHLLNVVLQEIHGNMTVNYVQLRGLDESALYKEQTTGRIYSGAALMHGGMPLPAEFGEYRAYQYHFVRE